jgi:membrane peptidoglycan carboxypeptidase
MPEKLQHGRDRDRSSRRDLDEWFGARAYHGWQDRRAARHVRLAAMSRGQRVARRAARLGTWLVGSTAALLIVAIGLFYLLSNVPRPESLPLPQVATIQYADGSVMARVGPVNRTSVSLDQVPEQVRWAVLAAEDRSFYSEPAVSIKGTLRAAMSDLTGGDTQGGSGITQQYVKNAYLSDARTLSRKLKELMIAIKLSREYSKDQILEFYLNTVYFGRNTYGIQAAAQTYFGVDVSKLTTSQAAVLAALLRAPSYYDPAQNLDAAKARWQYVIAGMISTGHLTADQEAKLRYPKVRKPTQSSLGTTGWKWLLVQRVFAELEAHGISGSEVYAKGLTIRTTIDPKAQQDAVTAIDQTFANLTPQQRNLKNALVAVNPGNGAILAYYGGTGPDAHGYDGKVDYNDYAGTASRPPGSSFKPYTLAAALTQTFKKSDNRPHYGINSYVDGSFCTTIQGTRICNDPSDQGLSSPSVTIATAMKYSLNTTFDELASTAGPDNVAKIAHAMGISQTNNSGQRTLVDKGGHTTFGIGIGDYPVTPLDQASGFATLADNGMHNDPYLVQKATSSTGEVVLNHKAAPRRVIEPGVANDVTLTLEPIADYSAVGLFGGRPSAAKTGTEGIGKGTNGNSDAWMVGFTPQVSAAVWVGTGYSKPIVNSYGGPEYGHDLPGHTWQLFMNTYLADKPSIPMPTQQSITGSSNAAAPIGPTPSPSPTTSAASSPSPTLPSLSLTTTFAPVSTPQPVSTTLTAPAPPLPSVTCSQPLVGPQQCTTITPPPGG